MAADPLARLRLTGLAGTLAVSLGGLGSGAWPRPDPAAELPVLGTLRDHPVPCALVALAGVLLLLAAWWRVATGPDGAPPLRWTLTTVVLWCLPLAVVPPLFSRDMYSYAAQGDLLLHGLDPYAAGPAAMPSEWLRSVSPVWWDTPAPYGPLFLFVAREAAALSGGHLVVALLLLRLVGVAGVALIGVSLPVLARRCGLDARRATWLGLASPLLLLHGVGGAHNDVLMLGLVLAGLAVAAGGAAVLGVVLVAVAVTVKASAVVALPFVAILWAARGRALLPTAAITAGVLTAAGAVTGLWFGWIGALGTPGVSVQWTSLPTGLGLAAGWVLGPALAPTALAAMRAIGVVAAVAIAAVLWWRVRDATGDPRRVVVACGAAFATVVVLSPAFQPWYALWALLPLAASTVDVRITAWPTAALSLLVLPDGYNLARAVMVPGVLLDVTLVVVGGVVAARWWRSRDLDRVAT